VRRIPERPPLEVFEVDDVADEVEPLALDRSQEVEQVMRLAIAQAKVNVRDEHAAERESGHHAPSQEAGASLCFPDRVSIAAALQCGDIDDGDATAAADHGVVIAPY
jgi:hypothetical protein